MTDATIALSRDDRKRLGQYFTGEPLARVLAAMADVRAQSAVIDPMAGSGNMLAAAMEVGGASDLTAVEIDPDASGCCRARFGSSIDLRVGNAFDPTTWTSDVDRSWDVVITNPPYVRYQRSSRSATGRVCLPSAAEIRAGLLKVVDTRQALSKSERDVFRLLVDGYSGLADLAVPSWLLCAALVAPGGRLAMLVPDTWLSRDYALPVLYVLRRFFDLEQVVEDGEASWFEDALVRTTLVVARRVPQRSSGLIASARHVHARLSSRAADDRSLVGALHPRAAVPEVRFAERLRRVAQSGASDESPGLTAEAVDDEHMRDRLASQLSRTTWGRRMEAAASQLPGAPNLPRRLRDLVANDAPPLCTIGDFGWNVGQGLRTGANRFFYGEFVSDNGETSTISVDRALSIAPITIPNDLLRVVVRRQQDVAGDGSGVAHLSPGRLLYLLDHALDEDRVAAEAAGGVPSYAQLPPELSEHVRRAAMLNVGSEDEPRLIPKLSAVVTNVRGADPKRPDRRPRFWYQLPPLAPRHTGDVFVARVCYGHPESLANPSGTVIDANFSTFWQREGEAALTPAALLALLRSSWSVAAMELSGTVLGGGALKIEATQLRHLPLPAAAKAVAGDLECLGQAAFDGTGQIDQREVDRLVWELLDINPDRAIELRLLAEQLLRNRMPR